MTKDSVNQQQLNKSKQHPLTKLVKTLSAFDPADLLTDVAGLQLMPENADRSVRIEFLAHVVASINSKGFGSKPKVNLKQLEKICKCDSPGIEQIVWMEDPFNNPFTEAFTFHGDHEAIVYETEHHRLTIPTRLACFSFESEMVEKLNKEFPERQKAALASRFIIEYVATRPPDGIRPFSLSAYDRLQALASEIVTFGFESDLINFSLADLKLEMLLSGRLGTDRDQYEKARDAYMSIFTGGEIVRATRRFGHYWRKPKTATEKSALVAQFDAAATIEFGYSITELLEFFGAAMDIGRDIHPSVACLPLRELIIKSE